MTELAPAQRSCIRCDATMPAGKRSDAVYCTRTCKTAASEIRRPKRDNGVRYLQEREHRLAYGKRYQRDNPDVPKRAKRKRKALMVGAGVFAITGKDWNRLLERFGHRCAYCGLEGRMSMEHVVPISRGGRHSIGNIVSACLTCNSSKRDRTIMEWRLKLPSPRQKLGRAACTQEVTAS